MRWTPFALVLTSLWACDLNEGPREETREAVEAARDGRSPETVRDQVDDIGQNGVDRADGVKVDHDLDHDRVAGDRTAFEKDLDRDLNKAERWVEEVRRDLASGARQADDEFDRSFESLERDLKSARQDYDKLSTAPDADRETLGENLREKLRQLSLRVDALDGEVDDKPGPDPMGPG